MIRCFNAKAGVDSPDDDEDSSGCAVGSLGRGIIFGGPEGAAGIWSCAMSGRGIDSAVINLLAGSR